MDECIGMYRDVGEWVRGKCAGILEGVQEVVMGYIGRWRCVLGGMRIRWALSRIRKLKYRAN